MGNLRGVSSIIVTVILVSIAIVAAIAFTMWAGSIVGLFTSFEKLEISAAYLRGESGGYRIVALHLANMGTTTIVIDQVFVNGRPHEDYGTRLERIRGLLMRSGSWLKCSVGDIFSYSLQDPISDGFVNMTIIFRTTGTGGDYVGFEAARGVSGAFSGFGGAGSGSFSSDPKEHTYSWELDFYYNPGNDFFRYSDRYCVDGSCSNLCGGARGGLCVHYETVN